MRNLKKMLSLVMALAMVASFMVVGASAAEFNDAKDIKNSEAVSILGQLNILSGYEDGSFKPTGIVTRAEMAKMICVALSGGIDPSLGTTSVSRYKDVPTTHWASAYIEYCTNLGIVSGDGSGNFNPDKAVTGTEAAKMLLVSIGYNAGVEKFTGASWDVNVNVIANDKKLYSGLSINPSTGLTRDDASQVIYNGISAGKVTYTYNMEVSADGSIATKPMRVDNTFPAVAGTNRVRTILNDNYGVDTYQGVVVANEYAYLLGGLQKEGQIRFDTTMKNDSAFAANMIVKANTTLDMLGKNVTLLIKDSKSNNVYDKVFGMAVVNDVNNIYTVSAKKDAGNSFTSDVKDAGVTTINANTPVHINYAASVTDVDNYGEIAALTGNGKIVTVLDNDNDNVADRVMVLSERIGIVSTYNSKGDGSITVANKSGGGDSISNEKFKNVIGIENIAKDDVISFYKLTNGKYYVTKLESVEGTVKSTTGLDKVSVDGTTYKQSALSSVFDEDSNVDLKSAVSVGDAAQLYLDASGYVVYVKAIEGATNFMYLTGLEAIGTISGVNAKAAFSDGTTATLKINSVTNAASKGGPTTKYTPGGTNDLFTYDGSGKVNGFNGAAGLAQNTIYTYAKRDDGSYDLKTMWATDKAQSTIAAGTILRGTPSISGGDISVVADSKTVFVVKDGDNWNVYTGIGAVPSMVSGGVAGKAALDGNASVVFVTGGVVAGDRKSVYILSDKYTVSKDDKSNTIYSYPAMVNGEWMMLKSDNTSLSAGGYYDETGTNLVSVSDGKWAAGTIPTVSQPGPITGFKNGVVTGIVADKTGGASDSLTVNDKTVVVLIDGSAEEDISFGSAGDLVWDSVYGVGGSAPDASKDSSTVALMVRASATSSDANYGVAGVIYIIL